jgi:hypothetical protein
MSVNSRRRTTIAGTSILLGIVALVLAVTANATGERNVLIAAIAVAVIAMLVATRLRTPKEP